MEVTSLLELKAIVEIMKEIYHTENGERTQLDNLIKEKEKKLEEHQKQSEFYQELLVLLQESAYKGREESKKQIENLVTKPLQFIFNDSTRFEVDLKNKGENSTANFSVVTDYDYGTVSADPTNGDGGGAADVVSLACLTTLLLSADTNISAPLFLDEPSKFVSDGHSLNVARFLHELSTNFNLQIIMSTHDYNIAAIADKSFRFILQKGISNVTVEDYINHQQ